MAQLPVSPAPLLPPRAFLGDPLEHEEGDIPQLPVPIPHVLSDEEGERKPDIEKGQ